MSNHAKFQVENYCEQHWLFFYKFNVANYFFLCYFCTATNIQCVSWKSSSRLGEDMGSWTHVNSTLTIKLVRPMLIIIMLIFTHTNRSTWCTSISKKWFGHMYVFPRATSPMTAREEWMVSRVFRYLYCKKLRPTNDHPRSKYVLLHVQLEQTPGYKWTIWCVSPNPPRNSYNNIY